MIRSRSSRVIFVVVLALMLTACSAPTASTVQAPTNTAVPTTAVGTATPAAGAAQQIALLAGAQTNAQGYVDLKPDQLNDLLKDKQFSLVNVHIPYAGELPDTDLFIAYDQIQDHLAELPAKDAPIVLYCRSGRMSTMAAQTLAQLGYTNIYELNGGMEAWQTAGYKILDKGRP
jgi:rhodanese-related sulfurtransferase